MKQFSTFGVYAISMTALAAQVSFAADRLALSKISSSLSNSKETELRFDFNGAPPNIQAYQIDKPLRLVVDLPATKSAINQTAYTFPMGSIAESYSVIDNPERTRVTFALKQKGSYTTRVDGKSLFLKFSINQAPAAVKAKVAPTSKNQAPPVYDNVAEPQTRSSFVRNVAPPPVMNNRVELPTTTAYTAVTPVVQQPAALTGPMIADIDFKKGGNAQADVVINLGDKSRPVDVSQQGTKVIAKFLGAKIPERLRRRLDVTDFSTAVQTIDAYNEGANGVVVIQTQGEIEQQSYQSDGRLIISIKRPVVNKKAVVNKNPVYTGKKLTVNFQDIEVRSVLALIADFTNINMVASDSVKDKITIRLNDVPWDQALDIILKTKGLAKRTNGNVVLIAPADELSALEKKEMQSIQQEEDLSPLRTEYMQLSFAKASDLVGLISSSGNGSSGGGAASSSSSAAPAGGGGSSSAPRQGLLSVRGSVSVDVRTNTIIVQDTSDRLEEIRNLISRIDVPVKQVMIEARIVRATDNFSKELGVKWGVLSNGIASNNSLLVGGSENTLFNLRAPTYTNNNGVAGVSYTIDQPQNLSVDLGVTSAGASRIALGLLSMSDLMIDLELSALQADGKGEVIATPKVLTADKQKARVASGTQIPYQTSAPSGGTTISFVNAELSLEVTPHITADGRIGMELLVNSDTPGTPLANGAVAINTNRVQTNVLVDDGQTVVLGGIFQNQTSNSTQKVPFLGDIPLLGRLFRKDVQSNNKQELLIFVTPRLMNDVTKVGK